jgi:predicted DNA-binding transcriptional regulator AlpA
MRRNDGSKVDPMAGYDAIQIAELVKLTRNSKSTIRRRLNGELSSAAPFPRPFKIGGMKINFWRIAEVRAWLDAEQQAGTR